MLAPVSQNYYISCKTARRAKISRAVTDCFIFLTGFPPQYETTHLVIKVRIHLELHFTNLLFPCFLKSLIPVLLILLAMKIHISKATKGLLDKTHRYIITSRGEVNIKVRHRKRGNQVWCVQCCIKSSGKTFTMSLKKELEHGSFS